MEDLIKALDIRRTLLTAYHSQIDCQIEWINQEIEMLLQYYINYQQNYWIKWLSAVEFQYNDKKHTAIGYTSFELNFR